MSMRSSRLACFIRGYSITQTGPSIEDATNHAIPVQEGVERRMKNSVCRVHGVSADAMMPSRKEFAVKIIALGLLAFLASSELRAEGGCPSGMIPHTGSSTNSCGPIPPGYYGDQEDRPRARWAKRWGAIAADPAAPSLGFSTGHGSKRSAEKAALSDCRAKGGTQCLVDLSYYNQCAALVVGDKRFNAAHAATVEAAIDLGTRTCEEASAGCRVFYTNCSYAERVQ